MFRFAELSEPKIKQRKLQHVGCFLMQCSEILAQRNYPFASNDLSKGLCPIRRIYKKPYGSMVASKQPFKDLQNGVNLGLFENL